MEKADLKFSELPFGYVPTDYNIRYTYKDGVWSKGELTRDVVLPLHISATCLHYGQELFEGLKAYERPDGKAQLFRIEQNALRMNRGAEKFLMASVPEEMFIDAVIRQPALHPALRQRRHAVHPPASHRPGHQPRRQPVRGIHVRRVRVARGPVL